MSFLVHLLENPHHRLHIVAIHSTIGVPEIYPPANMVYIPLPCARYIIHIELAFFDKFLYSNFFFYLSLGLQSQSILDFVFSWESMTVPSPYSSHAVPLHCLVPWEYIFGYTRKECAVVWQPRDEGGSV